MILLVNPRATKPRNRRFPLALLAIAGSLPEESTWEILDGNLPGMDLLDAVTSRVEGRMGGPDPVTVIALTVMPGPQLVSAVPLSRRIVVATHAVIRQYCAYPQIRLLQFGSDYYLF